MPNLYDLLYFYRLRHTVITLRPTPIFTAQKRDLHCRDAKPVEPGPAIHQADALQFELRRTLIWAMPHPIQLRFTLFELCRTLRSYAAPFWATPQNRPLLSYAVPYWAMLQPSWATPHPEKFSLPVGNGIPRVCFYLWFTERNSEFFSLPRKGSELNSEIFMFSGTAGIPTEITICSVYSVFRGFIFLSEIPNPKDTEVSKM